MYLAVCQEITLRVWGWHSGRQRWESEKERERKGRKKENPDSYHRLLFHLASTFPWLGYINQEVSHFGISKIPAEFKSLAAPRILIHTGNMLFAPKMKSLIVSMYFQLKTEYLFFKPLCWGLFDKKLCVKHQHTQPDEFGVSIQLWNHHHNFFHKHTHHLQSFFPLLLLLLLFCDKNTWTGGECLISGLEA